MPTPIRSPASRVAWAALLLAAGCSGRLAHHFDEVIERSYPLPEGTHTVEIEIAGGPVTVVPGKEPGVVRVHANTRRAADTAAGLAALRAVDLTPSAEASEPGILTLRGPSLPAGLAAVSHRLVTKAVVHVPPEIALRVRTGFGPLSANARRAPVRLETGHGDILLQDCRADAVLRTGLGVVMVQGHRGGLDVESGECETMQIFVDELGSTGLRLVTRRGGIQAHVPADTGFVLDARTGAGDAANSFGLPVEPLPGSAEGATMAGPVLGGGPPVVIRAEIGNISLRRRTVREG